MVSRRASLACWTLITSLLALVLMEAAASLICSRFSVLSCEPAPIITRIADTATALLFLGGSLSRNVRLAR